MNSPQIINDLDYKVKEALTIWSEWMRRGNTKEQGYGRCSGFTTDSSVSGWDDFEMKVENNLAINVQAIYEGLKHPQQLAIDHFHLAAVWRSNRSNLEDDYANALIGMQIGLRRRGLL